MSAIATRPGSSRSFVVFVLGLAAWLLPAAAFAGGIEYTASPGSGNQSFATKYPGAYATNSCNNCHTSAPTLNATYGTAYKNTITAMGGGRIQSNVGPALTAIEPLDSDADGYTNVSELVNSYKPYDNTSHPTASVALSTGANAQAGAPSSTVPYSVTVTNNGNIADSFTLGVSVFSGQSWTPSIVGTANNVAASGGTATITVNVAISGGATAGQTSVARVTAASQANAGVTATPLDLTTSVQIAAPRYVRAATGVNTGGCTSPASPCKTITYAMSQASTGNPGDTINVADGTYNVALGETFPIVMKSGVQLLGDGGAAIVDATGANNRVFNVLACNANTKITGLTIMGGLRQPTADGSNSVGGAMLIDSASSIRVGGNVFYGNEARGYTGTGGSFPSGGQAYGGAIYVNAGSTPTIVNNVFRNNIVRGGHGVDNFGSSTPGGSGGDGTGGAISAAGGTIVNNTFYGNKAIGGAGGFSLSGGGGNGGGAHSGGVDSSGANVYNNIFAANDATRGTGGTGNGGANNGVSGFAAYGSLQYSGASASNNLFFQSTVDSAPDGGDTYGSAFVLGDPLFHLAPSNLRIGVSSPAKAPAGTNTGLTTLDFDGVTRPNPPSIGAFEPSGAYLQMTDLNGDNRSDLLYRNTSTGQVWRFLMNGMSITQGAMAYVEPNTAWKIISDADFNGDGVSDLLYRNDATGQVYLLFMNSSGLPSSGGLIYTEPNLNWKIIHTPDIDGDGKADLLWWNSATGQVYVMLMNGLTIGTQALVYSEPNVNWKIVGVGDFAGSGKQNQLLWVNGSSGQVYLMTLVYTGSGFTQSGQTIYYANTQYKVVGIADFNGDGKHDVLWRNDSTGQLYIFLMNNAQIAFEGVIYQEANLAWKVVAVGDYNGDGRADILYRNDSTGMVWMLLMNGASVASQGLTYQEGNTAWRLLGPLDYAQ